MRRLHLRLYLTIVGTLVAFAICAAILWHVVAWPQGAAWSIETATHLSASMLDEVHAPALDQTIGKRWRSYMPMSSCWTERCVAAHFAWQVFHSRP
jgi:hypothetical protein